MTLSFVVAGVAQTAGSKRAVPMSRDWTRRAGVRWQVIDANDKSDGWKEVVAVTAKGALLALQRQTGERISAPLFDVPVCVTMVFRRQRPASHLNSKGQPNAHGLRHPYPDAKPDLLKTARGVEDALTGIAYTDDALIVQEVLVKEWGVRDEVQVFVEHAGVPLALAGRAVITVPS